MRNSRNAGEGGGNLRDSTAILRPRVESREVPSVWVHGSAGKISRIPRVPLNECTVCLGVPVGVEQIVATCVSQFLQKLAGMLSKLDALECSMAKFLIARVFWDFPPQPHLQSLDFGLFQGFAGFGRPGGPGDRRQLGQADVVAGLG